MPQYKFTPHTRQMIVRNHSKRAQVCSTHGVSRTWDYQLRKRAEEERAATGSVSLSPRSSRPHAIRTKEVPEQLVESDEYLVALYEKHHHPGYQKFFLYCKQEKPEWKGLVSERDVLKLYGSKGWLRKKKEAEKAVSYVKEAPGDMAHNDIKYLPRIEKGKDRPYFQEILDDATRMATACILMDKTAETAKNGIRLSMETLSIPFRSCLTDNGAETSYNTLPPNKKPKDKKHPVALLFEEKGIRHKFTRVCRPQTNGKSERLHKTLDDEVLSQYAFKTQEEMFEAIAAWLKWYNEERIHMSLRMTPLQKMLELNPSYVPPKTYLHTMR